jgi:hypothetical protein
MDAKTELNAEKMDRNHINGQHKCQDSLCVEHKNVQNIASDSCGTSYSDMIKQNYSKQNAYLHNKDKSSMEMDAFETLKESVVTPDYFRTADYITEVTKKQPQKDVLIVADNSVKCVSEESHWKDEMYIIIVEHKLERKLEDLNLKCDKHELELAYLGGSLVSCVEENKGKACVEVSDASSKPVRTSLDMNLTTHNIPIIPQTWIKVSFSF